MIRKRIHKDFDAVLVLSRQGEPINLSDYEIMFVYVCNRREKKEIQEWEVRDGKIAVHVSRNLITRTGEHWFEVEYRKPDPQVADGYYNYRDNSPLVEIVKTTEEEDNSSEPYVMTIDIIEVIRGERGFSAYEIAVKNGYVGTVEEWVESLKMKYSDLTESEIAELQLPATQAAQSLTTQVNEKLGQADTAIQNAETATANANTAKNNADTATSNANQAADLANQKAELAGTAAGNANSKAQLAGEKAGLADTAAQNAQQVANTYATELAGKQKNITNITASQNEDGETILIFTT